MQTNFQHKLLQHWQKSTLVLSVLLLPLSVIFYVVSTVLRVLYQVGCLKAHKLSVPVVVIGNINVGGVGKTPIVMNLVEALSAKGLSVGVVSRGYGRVTQDALMVDTDGVAKDFGDEPFLIAQRLKVPVAVASKRVQAAELLLKNHPDTQIVLSDDGLQHYAMVRDIEIVVVDAKQGFGNGYLLPQGPLREPVSKLKKAQAIVLTKLLTDNRLPESLSLPANIPLFLSHLKAGVFYSLSDSMLTRSVNDFVGQNILALAGIGQPNQFFDTLKSLGVDVNQTLAFEDHHGFIESDIPSGFDVVLVTEKDAVKLQKFALSNVWVLPVDATISPNLADWLMAQLKL